MRESRECPMVVPEEDDAVAKLKRRAVASEYSKEDLHVVLDVLANRYEELDDRWLEYFEALLAFTQESTKS